MKRNVTVLDRIRVFIKWIRLQEGYGLAGTCDFCRSTKLNRLESHTEQIDETTIEYTATYKCMNCDAVAQAKEIWKRGGKA